MRLFEGKKMSNGKESDVPAEKNGARSVITAWAICLAIMGFCTALGAFFHFRLGLYHSNVVAIYLLGVISVAASIPRRVCAYAAALMADVIYAIVFMHTEDGFDVTRKMGFLLNLLAMLFAAWLVGKLTGLVREHDRREKEAEEKVRTERMKSELLRTISHDLRTPLTSISGSAENLLNNGDSYDRETLRGMYSDIYSDSSWLISIVENLLANMRADDPAVRSGTTELMDDLIEEAVLAAHGDRKGRKVTVLPIEDVLLVKVDANLIVQVLVNLLDNAFRYTPEGTPVTVSAVRRGALAEVTVSDGGPGIPDDEKEKVFEKFYVGEPGGYAGRKGLGLGLALCRTIIKSYGGTIRVEDNVPTGASFIFTLPAEEAVNNE